MLAPSCPAHIGGRPVLVLLVAVHPRVDEQAHHPRAVLAPNRAAISAVAVCGLLVCLGSAPASTLSKRIIPAPCSA